MRFGTYSPLYTTRMRIFSWYSKSGKSFGVIKKYWERGALSSRSPSASSDPQTVRTICEWTRRSLRGSMPWLISSTTRKGALEKCCNDMRYIMMVTERSPPD